MLILLIVIEGFLCRPTNTACLELAQRLIEDFIVFSNKGPEQLKDLPAIAPRFVSNLITALIDQLLNR